MCRTCDDATVAERLTLPGFVNAHTHTFQRALRGSREGDDFWAWREATLALARQQTPETVRTSYAGAYREMRAAGYTAVGEFHYLGLPEAHAAVAAAEGAGVTLVVLLTAYARGGLERFRQPSVADYLRQVEELRAAGTAVGLAPHSVRACPPAWLSEIGRYAGREELVLHVHADEQPREIDECLAEHGARPIEVLADAGCVGPRTTIVHATHADDHELDLVAEAGARVCVCPTTEANLGDGFAPVDRFCERGIGLCIGSDSNARIDPLEELRELEGIARRASGRRNVIPIGSLLAFGADEGAASLGLESWEDVDVDRAHPSLSGVDESGLLGALVMSCGADVFVPSAAAGPG
jgi:formimidoylglutamate deiminase